MKPHIQLILLVLLGIAFFGIILLPLSFMFQMIFILFYIGAILVISFYIILERRSSTNTIVWILLILMLPIIGYFFYIYSGQLSRQGILFQDKRKKAHVVFDQEEPDTRKSDLQPLNGPQERIRKIVESYAQTPLRNHNNVKILTNGQEAFPEIMEKLKEAKSFIHMEYYLFNSDETGREMKEILKQKAQEGVTVRLLYDSAGSLKLKKKDVKDMQQAGIDVHVFLPIASGLATQTFNFRNHRKIIVIDNEIGFVGGMNVGDEYHGISEEFPDWRDTHMVLRGAAIKDLHLIFLVDWWYITNENLVEQYSTEAIPEPEQSNTHTQVVPSGPHNEHQIMRDVYTTLIHSAKKSVKIATPYFVPSREIHTALRIAAQQGLDVKLLIPKPSDNWLTYYAGHSYFPELLEDGIQIHLYEKDFMHHKIMIIDDETASIGTANMDLRSFYLNFEVNVILYGGEPVEKLIENYYKDLEESSEVIYEEFSKRKTSEKWKEAVARLFAPLL
ncbi:MULTISPECIES: cardiolipin synthase [Pontibacillus]|uniref:Cardiolipin synthase n=1 Tax=Pontibacillus chungwhensis TaxID=265426 RepID=A0ABY8V4U2_9BACI|nr:MULTISPECIES: cardiolipin synthase [Pontibacillus]MCD5324900.1 cardiolipin synthase [Pontibacillus sp. HN14]WIF98861.1 cardiolipin synthase [Pontibacillus chungwhensis]